MSRLTKSISALTIGLIVSLSAFAQGTMTDTQVLEYVKQATAQGKSRQELIAELSMRGVTRDQAQRVYNMYTQEQEGKQVVGTQTLESRQHTVADAEGEFVPAEEGNGEAAKVGNQENAVYGRNLFNNRNLTFAPSENMATPRNYRLGPGDEVIIDVFGRNQTTLRQVISPEGSINVDVLGPLYLSGKTVEEANTYLRKRLSQIYGGLSGGNGTGMSLSLGQIKSIQVSVLGDVSNPGTYRLSGFSTAFNALYRAGGIVDPGTLRNIKVVRSGEVVGVVDVYQFLQKGDQRNDIRLDDGDVILVQAFEEMVKVEGAVKRPMYFEMKEGESLAQLLEYAGGFTMDANTSMVTVFRQDGRVSEVKTVEEDNYRSFLVRNGDRVTVGTLTSRFENRVSISGAVFFPGTFELTKIQTAKALVNAAGGVLPEAFTDRVVVHREHDDRTLEVLSLNLSNILSGTAPDFVLQNNDELFIAAKTDLEDRGTMTIEGMVNNPGKYPFAENTTVEDFIIMAGGLKDGASTSRVDVTRRKKDASGLVATNDIGQMYTFSLKDGLIADGNKDFVLEPYDEVTIHKSPSYAVQRYFTVSGEVNFPGEYTLTSREERVSDLLEKAGGLTPFAYLKGARLVREATEEEITQARDLGRLLVKQMDSSLVVNEGENTLKTGTRHYSIALDLEKALANPGSNADVILRENDRLEIPVESNVVRVFGAVMYPTGVTYNSKMTVADYIDAAGGYSKNALRSRKYVVNMGGRAHKVWAHSKLEPGAEIYVPEKEIKEGKRDYSGIIALTSAASSVATLSVTILTIINNIKKN